LSYLLKKIYISSIKISLILHENEPMKTLKLISIGVSLTLLAGCLPGAGLALESVPLPGPSINTEAIPTQAALSAALLAPQPEPFSVAAMREREYGTGDFVVDRLWYSYTLFDRYYVIYDSDGLSIHGYVNVPKGEGPFPVVMMIHGWIPRDEYETLDYTLRYADHLAKNGYIVLHPNMRSFPPSDPPPSGTRDFHAGYTADILNMIAYVREMAGTEGIFRNADVSRMGIWGHSIGGSIAMRAMSVEPDTFQAALLYAPVSQRYGGVVAGSDIYDLSSVISKLSIHHGEDDEVIRVGDSRRLCDQMENNSLNPDCYFYEGQPHTFYRDQWADPLLMERTLELFDQFVKN
jgi:dienelactone hydrolase